MLGLVLANSADEFLVLAAVRPEEHSRQVASRLEPSAELQPQVAWNPLLLPEALPVPVVA